MSRDFEPTCANAEERQTRGNLECIRHTDYYLVARY